MAAIPAELSLTSEKVEDAVRGWLVQEGYNVSLMKEPGFGDLLATKPQANPIIIEVKYFPEVSHKFPEQVLKYIIKAADKLLNKELKFALIIVTPSARRACHVASKVRTLVPRYPILIGFIDDQGFQPYEGGLVGIAQ